MICSNPQTPLRPIQINTRTNQKLNSFLYQNPKKNLIQKSYTNEKCSPASQDKGISCDLSYQYIDTTENQYLPKIKILKKRKNGLTVFTPAQNILRLQNIKCELTKNQSYSTRNQQRKVVNISRCQKQRLNVKIQLSHIWSNDYCK